MAKIIDETSRPTAKDRVNKLVNDTQGSLRALGAL